LFFVFFSPLSHSLSSRLNNNRLGGMSCEWSYLPTPLQEKLAIIIPRVIQQLSDIFLFGCLFQGLSDMRVVLSDMKSEGSEKNWLEEMIAIIPPLYEKEKKNVGVPQLFHFLDILIKTVIVQGIEWENENSGGLPVSVQEIGYEILEKIFRSDVKEIPRSVIPNLIYG
jgi:hypothetical protein